MAALTPRQSTRVFNGKEVTVLIQSFADKILVLVTQLGKVGSLIQATIPVTAPLIPAVGAQNSEFVLPEPSPAIELLPLMGSAPSPHLQTLHSLYASQIATVIWTEEAQKDFDSVRKSVVVGIALAKTDQPESGISQIERELFQGVMKMVHDLLQ